MAVSWTTVPGVYFDPAQFGAGLGLTDPPTSGLVASSKAKQKDTIEKELSQEESMLADARRKLTEQEGMRSGNEQNYAKVIERLKPYKDTVEVHEKNVEALKRELSNLSR